MGVIQHCRLNEEDTEESIVSSIHSQQSNFFSFRGQNFLLLAIAVSIYFVQATFCKLPSASEIINEVSHAHKMAYQVRLATAFQPFFGMSKNDGKGVSFNLEICYNDFLSPLKSRASCKKDFEHTISGCDITTKLHKVHRNWVHITLFCVLMSQDAPML